jgi:mannose-6-phosphate isomerase-like protein (cupin superfamily)
VVVRASADTSGGAFTIIEETSPVDTPRHVHENEDEIFYVLEGDYVIQSATRSSTSVRVGWPLDRAASPMRSAASCRGPGAS